MQLIHLNRQLLLPVHENSSEAKETTVRQGRQYWHVHCTATYVVNLRQHSSGQHFNFPTHALLTRLSTVNTDRYATVIQCVRKVAVHLGKGLEVMFLHRS
jgi:hypothetical protein